MKTKFDSLVKIKKQELSNIEAQMIKNSNLIAHKYQELDILQNSLGEVCVPQNGSYWDFKRTAEIKKSFTYEMDCKHKEISELKAFKKHLDESYRLAFIEFEKMNYLQKNEIKKELEALRKTEAKNLDEIALMLFSSDKENV